MKKIFKAGLAVAGTAVAVGAAAYALCDVIDGLLVNRNMVVSDEFNSKVSGTDMSHLQELCERNMNWVENYGYERHTIISDRGHKLVGYLMRPEKPSDVYVFGAHGYRCNGKKEFCGFAQYYLKKGVNIFFPDHTGSGESEGKYIGFGYYEKDDCIKWLKYLNSTFGSDIKLVLHGVSMGAATVMMMSSSNELPENVKMIVSDCGYTSCIDEFEDKLNALNVPASNLIISAVNHINKRKAGYDFRDIKPIECVKQAKVPMLFVHGSADNFVPFYMGSRIYEACNAPYKEFLVVEGADHAQSSVDGAEEYEAKLDEYLEKFVFEKDTVEKAK